jgi:hypothetical protein
MERSPFWRQSSWSQNRSLWGRGEVGRVRVDVENVNNGSIWRLSGRLARWSLKKGYLKRQDVRVGVWWKGCRKQPPKGAIFCHLFTGTETYPVRLYSGHSRAQTLAKPWSCWSPARWAAGLETPNSSGLVGALLDKSSTCYLTLHVSGRWHPGWFCGLTERQTLTLLEEGHGIQPSLCAASIPAGGMRMCVSGSGSALLGQHALSVFCSGLASRSQPRSYNHKAAWNWAVPDGGNSSITPRPLAMHQMQTSTPN